MSIIVEPFKPEHLQLIELQPAQDGARVEFGRKEYGEALAQSDSFTAFIDGRIVACAGVVPMWEGRGDAWALVSGGIGPYGMRAVHFAVLRYLNSCRFRRVEAACDAGFAQAHRWLRLLGFAYEGPLSAYTPDGRDCLRFARVR